MDIEVNCYFRIGNLSNHLCSLVGEKCASEVEYEESSHYLDETKKVVSFSINKNTKLELLVEVLGILSKDADYDFFISVFSDQQSVVVNVPDYVLDLHKTVGGKMCFSYTCVYENGGD